MNESGADYYQLMKPLSGGDDMLLVTELFILMKLRVQLSALKIKLLINVIIQLII